MKCRDCQHPEDSHGWSHVQATYWCEDCGAWCDYERADGGYYQ